MMTRGDCIYELKSTVAKTVIILVLQVRILCNAQKPRTNMESI